MEMRCNIANQSSNCKWGALRRIFSHLWLGRKVNPALNEVKSAQKHKDSAFTGWYGSRWLSCCYILTPPFCLRAVGIASWNGWRIILWGSDPAKLITERISHGLPKWMIWQQGSIQHVFHHLLTAEATICRCVRCHFQRTWRNVFPF